MDDNKKKVIIDTGIFSRELLEKACREIEQKKQQKKESKSA